MFVRVLKNVWIAHELFHAVKDGSGEVLVMGVNGVQLPDDVGGSIQRHGPHPCLHGLELIADHLQVTGYISGSVAFRLDRGSLLGDGFLIGRQDVDLVKAALHLHIPFRAQPRPFFLLIVCTVDLSAHDEDVNGSAEKQLPGQNKGRPDGDLYTSRSDHLAAYRRLS